jgi:cytochrome P450
MSISDCKIGAYGCIGKPLALMEMRTLVAALVSKFDVRLAPGETGSNLLDKTRDQFTIKPADLFLVFEEHSS